MTIGWLTKYDHQPMSPDVSLYKKSCNSFSIPEAADNSFGHTKKLNRYLLLTNRIAVCADENGYILQKVTSVAEWFRALVL